MSCPSSTFCQINQASTLCSTAKGRANVISLNGSFDALRGQKLPVTYVQHTNNSIRKGRIHCSSTDFGQENSPGQPDQESRSREQESSFSNLLPLNPNRYLSATLERRRPYNIEAKMRMKQYRRQAQQQQRLMALEEEARNFHITPDDCYKRGDPDTVDAIITEINHIGVFARLPNGRDGFLPATQLGCMGSLALMERLFRVGEEITVRVIQVPQPTGKDRLFLRKT